MGEHGPLSILLANTAARVPADQDPAPLASPTHKATYMRPARPLD